MHNFSKKEKKTREDLWDYDHLLLKLLQIKYLSRFHEQLTQLLEKKKLNIIICKHIDREKRFFFSKIKGDKSLKTTCFLSKV